MKQTDAAALAAGGVAVVLTTYLDEGRYDVLGAMVALTLTVTLLSYLLGAAKSGWQRAAFGAVVGLTATPLVGFAIEISLTNDLSWFFSWDEMPRKVGLAQDEELTSVVGSWPTLIAWLGVGASTWFVDAWLYERREWHAARAAKKVDAGSSPA